MAAAVAGSADTAASPSGDRPTVTLVGLGHMGAAIAERLLDAGYPLQVFNRTAGRDAGLVERGAVRLESPGAALAEADVCITSLADDDAVEAVLLGDAGVLAHAAPGSVLVDTSTISVAASRRVAEAAEAAEVAYLRAPLSGNPTAIRNGKAAVIVSGPEDAARRLEPVLSAIAPAFRHVGDGEGARVLKLVLQILIGGTAGILAEAVALGEAAGIERRTVLEVIGASVVGSAFVEYKSEPLLRDDYSATFTTAMMVKDADLIRELAREVGADVPLTDEVRSLLEEACERGHADEDFMALLLVLRERAAEADPEREKG
jgi:3-hydroxyisobutyrate dehydrogenase-like beta-hydroxyacid dehydrogenase